MRAALAWLQRCLPQAGFRAARKTLSAAGLAFPQLPPEQAGRLTQQKKWQFASRQIEAPPYDLEAYSCEFDTDSPPDYVLLAHDGHGLNSHAIQYYLVQPGLGMFLHMAWGGVYMDNDQAARNIAACFALADRVVDAAAQRAAELRERPLKVVACDFYGSHWAVGGDSRGREGDSPLAVLEQALDWLMTTHGSA